MPIQMQKSFVENMFQQEPMSKDNAAKDDQATHNKTFGGYQSVLKTMIHENSLCHEILETSISMYQIFS